MSLQLMQVRYQKTLDFFISFSTQGYPRQKSSHQLAWLFLEMRYRKIHNQLLQVVDRIASPKLTIFSKNLCSLEFCLHKYWVSVSRSSYISDINILDNFLFDWSNTALLKSLITSSKSLPLWSNTISS